MEQTSAVAQTGGPVLAGARVKLIGAPLAILIQAEACSGAAPQSPAGDRRRPFLGLPEQHARTTRTDLAPLVRLPGHDHHDLRTLRARRPRDECLPARRDVARRGGRRRTLQRRVRDEQVGALGKCGQQWQRTTAAGSGLGSSARSTSTTPAGSTAGPAKHPAPGNTALSPARSRPHIGPDAGA
jgi:hypothetical protein